MNTIGEHKKAIATARNLKGLNTLSDQQIADATGLPLSEVETLTSTQTHKF